jgi:hypothetical protein
MDEEMVGLDVFMWSKIQHRSQVPSISDLLKTKKKERMESFVRHACLILGVIKVRKLRLFLSKKNIHHKSKRKQSRGGKGTFKETDSKDSETVAAAV